MAAHSWILVGVHCFRPANLQAGMVSGLVHGRSGRSSAAGDRPWVSTGKR